MYLFLSAPGFAETSPGLGRPDLPDLDFNHESLIGKRAEHCFESTVSGETERELIEFLGKLGEFCKELGEFAYLHTNNRLRRTH